MIEKFAPKKRIIPYSLKKIWVKGELKNSTLKPETSSLSPSLKSKGARLHSDKVTNKEIIKKEKKKKEKPDQKIWKPFKIKKGTKKMKESKIS